MSVKATYSLKIDLNNDGFLTQNEELIDEVMSISYKSGRDGTSNLTHLASAGEMTIKFRNNTGKFDENNPNSPLFGRWRRGLRVVLSAFYGNKTYKLITMYTHGLEANVYRNRMRNADMTCFGPMWWADRDDLKFAILYNDYVPQGDQLTDTQTIRSGEMLDKILEKIDWPDDLKHIDEGRSHIRPFYAFNEGVFGSYTRQVKFLESARVIEQSENGFLHEDKNGAIVFEDRDRRLKRLSDNIIKNIASDVDSLNDTYITYSSIRNVDTFDDIYNSFYPDYNVLRTDNNAIVRDLTDNPAIKDRVYSVGSQHSLIISRNNRDDWDYVKQYGTIEYELTDEDDNDIFNANALIYLTNKGPTSATVNWRVIGTRNIKFKKFIIRGDLVADNPETGIIVQDAESIRAFGKREFPFSARLIRDVKETENRANWLLQIYKNKRPSVEIEVDLNNNDRNMKNLLDLEITDIVLLSSQKLGIVRPHTFFVETLRHEIERGGYHKAKITLSSLERIQPFFVLDHSILGDTTALHY